MRDYIKIIQPLLKVGNFILVNGNRRKVTYISESGFFEWGCGWAEIKQLETNTNNKSKILFTINNN